MKVLVVEPNRHLLYSLNQYLTNRGDQVILAFDGVIAVNDFDVSIDLLIINVASPRITYLETIELLKKKKNNLKVFLITDKTSLNYLDFLNNEDIDEIFTLPFLATQLEFALDNISKNKQGYTIKETYILNLLKNREHISYLDISNKVFKKDELDEIILALEEKTKQKIIIEEKGFKLVKDHD